MLNELAKEVHQNAVDHGWWEEERSFGDIIALCHSELSEALEEYRDLSAGSQLDKRIKSKQIYYSGGGYICDQPSACSKKPEGIAVELADCIIRILDYCGKEGIDIEAAIRIKHEYNKTRPYRHGGKKI